MFDWVKWEGLEGQAGQQLKCSLLFQRTVPGAKLVASDPDAHPYFSYSQ